MAIAELSGWWLEVECDCQAGRVSLLPLRLLAAMRGWDVPLAQVIGKLRCQQCGAAPVQISLVDDASGAPGGGRPAKTRVMLLASRA